MTNNPILDELHAIRERLLAESGGTVSGLVARLQTEQAASDRPKFKPADDQSDAREADLRADPAGRLRIPPE